MLWKYPRTYHFEFSPGKGSDDKVLHDLSSLEGIEVVITEKMDGENITIYRNIYHSRSLDSKYHWTHSWLLNYISGISYKIPEGMRVCGEYLYATHSIFYDNLPSYFLAFSVWRENICLDWDSTVSFCKKREIHMVPLIYRGKFNLDVIKDIIKAKNFGEGFVVRPTEKFKYEDFSKLVVKYVRENHVTSDIHWKKMVNKEKKINLLSSNNNQGE